jgi:adenosylmethionine-8-amino-7-oxononanoate aminotransferase
VPRAGGEAGVLLSAATGPAHGTNGDAIVLGPPFVVSDDELVAIADRLAAAIEAATATIPTRT